MNKWIKGRKWTSTMVVAALAAFNDALDLGIEHETIMLIAGIVGVFILGESVADAASAFGEKREKIKANGDGPPAPTTSV